MGSIRMAEPQPLELQAAIQAILQADHSQDIATHCRLLFEQQSPAKLAELYLELLLAAIAEGSSHSRLAHVTQNIRQFSGFESSTADLQSKLLELTQTLLPQNQPDAFLILGQLQKSQPNSRVLLLQYIELGLQLKCLSAQVIFGELKLVNCLRNHFTEPDLELSLLAILEQLIEQFPEVTGTIEVAQFLEEKFPSTALFHILFRFAGKVAYQLQAPTVALDLFKLCDKLKQSLSPPEPEPTTTLELLWHLAFLSQNAKQYQAGIAFAQQRFSMANSIVEKYLSNALIIRGSVVSGTAWEQLPELHGRSDKLASQLAAEHKQDQRQLAEHQVSRLFLTNFMRPYVADQPQQSHNAMQLIGQIAQDYISAGSQQIISHPSPTSPKTKLKIGYISHCLKEHSVGWLCRWLYQHHNRDAFEINSYLLNVTPFLDNPLCKFFIEKSDQAHHFNNASKVEIAQKIAADQVDILIDLDSVTYDLTCSVMALKPAPIQATWLGWDASELPAIDYYIADHDVLPDDAETYYGAKLLRLPQSYLAIDGFEVGVPSLTKSQLGIPPDAVTFLSAQAGMKRHPDMVHRQLQIIQQTPNSYLLLKGIGNQEAIRQLFLSTAQTLGVDSQRICFLDRDPSSEVHRANLSIADVVLDTYPYNGATTTMEALWCEVPLVTLVGKQFAARNSYTMLRHAGIESGIAWTEDEYVDWGIRYGTDPALRQQVRWQLKQSKRTAYLWNAEQFTRDLEAGYQQMWTSYAKG